MKKIFISFIYGILLAITYFPVNVSAFEITSCNKTDASGMLGAEEVARSQADVYTLLFHNTAVATFETLYRNQSFNAVNDFEPIGQVVDFPMSLIARKEIPVQSVQDLKT